MNQDNSKTMDAAEKLMLDLMEKHPGASASSLLALFPKRRKGKDQKCCEQLLANRDLPASR
jgi:hypothetical protein